MSDSISFKKLEEAVKTHAEDYEDALIDLEKAASSSGSTPTSDTSSLTTAQINNLADAFATAAAASNDPSVQDIETAMTTEKNNLSLSGESLSDAESLINLAILEINKPTGATLSINSAGTGASTQAEARTAFNTLNTSLTSGSAGTGTLSISEATLATTKVQIHQSLSEMATGIAKNAADHVKGQGRKISGG